MKIYAIKQLSTGWYLPDLKRGHSYAEPEPPSKFRNPRFFPSERSARCALIAWLRGHFTTTWHPEDGRTLLDPTPQPHRVKTDYAVVSLIVTEE